MKNKQKEFNKFTIVKRGYDAIEVEKQLERLAAENRELSERLLLVDGLKEQNERLAAELADFKKREKEITEVLAAATAKAEDIMTDAKLQYALEIERVKLFQAKWENAYEVLRDRYRLDKDSLSLEGVLTDAVLQLEQQMFKDFGIRITPRGDEAEQQFRAEVERLDISQEEINKLVEKLKVSLKEVG